MQGLLGDEPVRRGDRLTITPYELDVHPFGEHRDFAMEYNGIFWHSLENDAGVGHVLEKVQLCEERGIALLNLWEDEFLADKSKVMQFVRDYLFNRQKLIDAETRNGTLDEVVLDRMVFNKSVRVPGYELVAETEPEIVRRTRTGNMFYSNPTAGKLVYHRVRQ